MAPTPSKSLCFIEARRAKRDGSISEDEYYHHALAHLAGVVHDEDLDDSQKTESCLKHEDPFGLSIRSVIKELDAPIQDMPPIEQVFTAYRSGSVGEVKALHDSLDEKVAPHIRRILAMRALWDTRWDMLNFFLVRGGFEYDACFIELADSLRTEAHPELMSVMEGSEFRRLHPRKMHRSAIFDAGGPLSVDW